MGDRLKGKVAVVTGAGRGLGRAHALSLAAEGAKVVVNDFGGAWDGTGSSTGPGDEVVAEIHKAGGKAVPNYDSVATKEGGGKIIDTAIDSFGRLDILVNNAGILRDRMIFKMTEEEWDAVIKTHLYGHFYCTQAACVIFREQRSGRIINTSSEAWLGNLSQANYSAAKAGIIGFTRTVARDMGRYGVTCNAICPLAKTRLGLRPEQLEAAKKAAEKGDTFMIELWRRMEHLMPEDVSPFVVYLATDEAANINGCVFSVQGGDIGIYPDPVLTRIIHKEGRWTVDELIDIMPRTIAKDLANPAPPAPAK
jgi:NAD(P)-dependent dehydrogenase (short-subunit alcohol dehydrogenase family)